MEYIMVARSCSDCGGYFAVMASPKKPTSNDEKELVDSLGGMFCIQTKLFRLNDEGKYDLLEES